MSETSTKTDVRLAVPDGIDVERVERWTYHQARDNPVLAWMTGLFPFVVLTLILVTTGKWYLGMLAWCAAALVLWRQYLPVTYELDARGLRQTVWKFRRFVPWKLVERAELRPNGLLLLPYASNDLFAGLLAIYVPCGEWQARVQQLVEMHAPWAATWARKEVEQ